MAGRVHKEPSVLEPRLVSDGALWEVVLPILKCHQLAEGLQSYKNRRAGQRATGLSSVHSKSQCRWVSALQRGGAVPHPSHLLPPQYTAAE